jgi:hypothetical protein
MVRKWLPVAQIPNLNGAPLEHLPGAVQRRPIAPHHQRRHRPNGRLRFHITSTHRARTSDILGRVVQYHDRANAGRRSHRHSHSDICSLGQAGPGPGYAGGRSLDGLRGTRMDLSVIVPTLHDTEGARRAAEAVEVSCRDLEAEIILADNGSRDELRDWAFHYARRAAVPVRWVPVRDIGLHNARHAGVRAAQGRVIAFVDDDAVVAPTWGPAVVDSFADPDLRLLTGPCRPRFAEPPPPWFQSLWSTTKSGFRICPQLSLLDGGAHIEEIDPHLVWGLNFVTTADTIHDAGGFHPDAFPWSLRRFRGDGETSVGDWVRQQCGRALYLPEAAVEHHVPASRLTPEYLLRREQLQGISQSYSAFRSTPGSAAHHRREELLSVQECLIRLIHGINRLRRIGRRAPPIGIVMGQPFARRRGWSYHRRLLRRSAEIRSWVCRTSYWDETI